MSYQERFYSQKKSSQITSHKSKERSLGIMIVNKTNLDFIRTRLSTNGQETEIFQDDADLVSAQRGCSLMLHQTKGDDIHCIMLYTISARQGKWHLQLNAKWNNADSAAECEINFTEDSKDLGSNPPFLAVTDEEGRIYTVACKAEEKQRRQGHITLSVRLEEGI